MPTYASTRQVSGVTSTAPLAPNHSACWPTTKGGLSLEGGLTMPKIKLAYRNLKFTTLIADCLLLARAQTTVFMYIRAAGCSNLC